MPLVFGRESLKPTLCAMLVCFNSLSDDRFDSLLLVFVSLTSSRTSCAVVFLDCGIICTSMGSFVFPCSKVPLLPTDCYLPIAVAAVDAAQTLATHTPIAHYPAGPTFCCS